MAQQMANIVLISILNTALLGALAVMIGLWGWALWRIGQGGPLLPEFQGSFGRLAPWGSGTVLAVIVLYLSVNVSVMRFYMAATGRHLPREEKPAARVEGDGQAKPPDIAKAEQPGAPGAVPPPAGENVPPGGAAAEGQAAPTQTQAELLLQLAVINLLLLALVPGLARWTSGATLSDFGWTLEEWPRQVRTGFVAAVLMTPVVYVAQFCAIHIWPPRKHPVEQMMLDSLTPGTAFLAVVSTTILAPLIEELLFRGIVLRWLNRVFGEPDAPEHSLDPPADRLAWLPEEPWHGADAEESARAPEPEPWAKELSASPAPRPGFVPVLVTALLFAAMHMPQWPAPVAILLLAIGLGVLYQRTGSLLSVVVMHATFNGFSTLLLLVGAIGRHLPHP